MSQDLFRTVEFVTSAMHVSQLPADEGREVAFSGRSNVGKSSLINALCRRRKLVRVSKSPGRTQALNCFQIDSGRRLIDLPGYGFAKVPTQVQSKWRNLVESYLQQRQSLVGLVVIMDARHPLQKLDWQMLAWCEQLPKPILLVLNKADKLSKSAALQVQADVAKQLSAYALDDFSLLIASATRHTGVDKLRQAVTAWLTKKSPGH
jgi:GTP-binding protein